MNIKLIPVLQIQTRLGTIFQNPPLFQYRSFCQRILWLDREQNFHSNPFPNRQLS